MKVFIYIYFKKKIQIGVSVWHLQQPAHLHTSSWASVSRHLLRDESLGGGGGMFDHGTVLQPIRLNANRPSCVAGVEPSRSDISSIGRPAPAGPPVHLIKMRRLSLIFRCCDHCVDYIREVNTSFSGFNG